MAAASGPDSDLYSTRFILPGRCKLSASTKTKQYWARTTIPQMLWSQCQLAAFLRIWRFVKLAWSFLLWSGAGIKALVNALSFYAWFASSRFQINFLARFAGTKPFGARESVYSVIYSWPPKFVVSCFAADLACRCLKRSLFWPQNVSAFTAVAKSPFQSETNPIELL
jgi:hypothetical protein